VNGIINIVTRAARDTQGLLVTAGGGTEDEAFGTVRYGGTAGRTSYRGYMKAFDRGPEFHADNNNYDSWKGGQAGFRLDRPSDGGRSLTVQGDAYDGRLGERSTVAFYTPPFSQTSNVAAPLSGGNVLARLSGRTGSTGDFQLQMYYDRTSRTEVPTGENHDTVDIDFQHNLKRWSRNAVVWGGGYRLLSSRITAVAPTAFAPNDRTDNLFSAFVQDEVALAPERFKLTLGSKFEHNSYSGFEAQPTARLLWTPDRVDSLFAAVTRAVRTPSRVETDYTTTSLVSAATPAFVRLLPDPGFEPEKLIAYELGYRARLGGRAYLTVSGFYNDFHDLLSTELLTPFVESDGSGPPRLILPVEFENRLHGNSHGVEATADVRPTAWWRLTGNYSYLDVAVTRDPGGQDVSQEANYEGAIPHHQARFGTSFDVQGGWSFDVLGRFVSALKAGPVPRYATADARAAWRATKSIELSLVGQDLFNNDHLEWPSGTPSVGIARSVYGQITLQH
jgi:iron complex outermembrane receptor protein